MRSTSFAFRDAVREGRHLETRADMTFADGTSTTLYGEDMAMGGMSCTGATSSSGSFDIGAAIVGSATLTLANFGGEWDDADFTGAEATLYVGAALDGGGREWLRMGTYGVEQPESYDASIELALHDNMRLFQVSYADVSTTYPATLQTIVGDVCLACGVTMLSAAFPNCSQVVAARPDDSRATCLDVLSWAAQMAGCFCDMDPWGRLRVRWYATSAFEVEDWLDGGTFSTPTTPYSDGDVADGGHFHYGGDSKSGGSFSNAPWAVVSAIRSLTTATDDVVITGVSVTASDQVSADGTAGEDGETYLYGTSGYVLSIDGNPLIQYGRAQSVAQAIGPAIVGMRFRPLTVTAHGDPAIEPGDPLLVVDRRQRTYRAWATQTTWKAGGLQSTSCDAETPARNRAEGYSAATRAIVEQRNAIKAERTARELAVANLARELSEASGLFKTEQEQQDHSIIYYLHDKPTLADSQIVWKMTSAAFGVSVDGGATYPFGFDAWGNAILNAIYAIGIDASYIDTGQIVVGPSSSPLFFADFDTGEARLAASVEIGGKTAAQIASAAVSAQTQADIFNKLTNNGALQGLYMSGGQLYMNATYIKTGALLASLITSGKIQSANGKVYFDLTNNELHCDRLVSTGSGTVGNFTASIKSSTLYGYTIYGLALDNSNYANGTLTLSPGTANSSNLNYRPKVSAKDGIYIFGGSDYASPWALVKVTPSDGVEVSVEGYYSGGRQRGPQLVLAVPTSNTAPTYDMELETVHNCRWSFDKSGAKLDWGGYGPTLNWLVVSGNKSRVVETDDYGRRLLYCYESPAPLFGDVGSGVIDEDGTCVVSIDDAFTQCARTDMSYRVFLQKCGPGDLWVSEKAPGYFVVEGTPGLAFDWEAKAHQTGFEADRLEGMEHYEESRAMGEEDLTPLRAYEQDGTGEQPDPYEDELRYIEEIELLYEEEAA